MADVIPFDQRDGALWFDGKLVPWRDAKVHVLTHGLHYASCVFEGERMYNGRIYKLEEHTARLFESARILGMTIPFTPARSRRPLTRRPGVSARRTPMSAPSCGAAAR